MASARARGGAGRVASRERRRLSRGLGSARFLVSRGGRAARGERGSSAGRAGSVAAARAAPPGAQRPRRAAMPAQNTASSGGEGPGRGAGSGGAAGGGAAAGERGRGGGGGRAPVGNRALVAEPLGAEMGEQAEAAVITPAMLKEEEQLEAAGLEKERQMLEKVRGGPGGGEPPHGGWGCPPGGWVCRGASGVRPLAVAGGPGPGVVQLL